MQPERIAQQSTGDLLPRNSVEGEEHEGNETKGRVSEGGGPGENDTGSCSGSNFSESYHPGSSHAESDQGMTVNATPNRITRQRTKQLSETRQRTASIEPISRSRNAKRANNINYEIESESEDDDIVSRLAKWTKRSIRNDSAQSYATDGRRNSVQPASFKRQRARRIILESEDEIVEAPLPKHSGRDKETSDEGPVDSSKRSKSVKPTSGHRIANLPKPPALHKTDSEEDEVPVPKRRRIATSIEKKNGEERPGMYRRTVSMQSQQVKIPTGPRIPTDPKIPTAPKTPTAPKIPIGPKTAPSIQTQQRRSAQKKDAPELRRDRRRW